ncbi:MAG: tRNA (adenosine(37)-N6)-dimethylallyltransferase MiaA [Bacteroidetes bacterium]|nr:tRNA (adenosine(37)-N6)-dimethylallyltransferase MiaA [Bacteroidota bacterium]MBU2584099.1 tRNA (adenosine(37)-N6)-dimethylallyltransferase MiaA [Bacteroidota bacterium]
MERRLIAIVGPTCSGKSDLAFQIAEELQTEIISADSRQIYNELTIGTAKPPVEYLNKIKHHFIDHISIDETYNVGIYSKESEQIIDTLFSNGKIPIVVGGSGLYISSLLYGIFESPEIDFEVRKKLELELEESGLQLLIEKLKKADFKTYSIIDLKNPRRVIRALEVFESTGFPISQLQKMGSSQKNFTFKIFGLNWDRKILYSRINKRVLQMIDAGLIEEVVGIINDHSPDNNTILHTVGYKEVIDYLKGNITKDKMTELIQRNTRRYAKRQMTWFRKNEEIQWFDLREESNFTYIKNEILKEFRGN